MDRAEAQHEWIRHLTQRFTLGSARDACDLLVVTSMDDVAIRRVRASFVACLADAPANMALVPDGYATLSAKFGAAGVGWVGRIDAQQAIADWFETMLREVSHDVPIATALSVATMSRVHRPPIVFGSARALDMCRILAIAERLDRAVAMLSEFRSSFDGSVPAFRGPAGSDNSAKDHLRMPTHAVAADLAEKMRRREFVAESVDGRRAVDEFDSRERILDEIRVARRIQASGWSLDAPQLGPRSLAAGQWNLLSVHIGPTQRPRSDAAFPEGALNFGLHDEMLTVQLELAGAEVTALQVRELPPRYRQGSLTPDALRHFHGPMRDILRQLQRRKVPEPSRAASTVGLASTTIQLPELGDSTIALFAVFPERAVRLKGRVLIIHRNRVLQTAELLVTTTASATSEAVTVQSAEPIHPRDDDLDERRSFDVSIGVSDVGGKLHLTVQTENDRDPTAVDLSSMKSTIAAIRKHLKAIAEEWSYEKPMLDQQVFHARCWGLAAAGAELNRHLRTFFDDATDHWERIHILPYTNELLPLEYVYAGVPPRVGARVCPDVASGLRAGTCGTCPNRQDKAFVCPVQFWGFHRVIERSGMVRPHASKATGPRAVPSRQPYGNVSSLVFAASSRTFHYKTTDQERTQERNQLVAALEMLVKGVDPAIDDWKKWRVAAREQPNLLVLLVHTDKLVDTPVLEIGSGEFLGKHEIDQDITGASRKPLMLVLLGCSVAGVDDDFEPYPQVFREAGASIVLGTIGLIRGEDAVRIAKRISAALGQQLANPEAATIGDMLPLLRRTLLSEGYPGMMGLVGFGDADWMLGGRDAAS